MMASIIQHKHQNVFETTRTQDDSLNLADKVEDKVFFGDKRKKTITSSIN